MNVLLIIVEMLDVYIKMLCIWKGENNDLNVRY